MNYYNKLLRKFLPPLDPIMWLGVLLLVIAGFCWTCLKCSCGAFFTRLLHWWGCSCWSYDLVREHAHRQFTHPCSRYMQLIQTLTTVSQLSRQHTLATISHKKGKETLRYKGWSTIIAKYWESYIVWYNYYFKYHNFSMQKVL